MNSLHLKRNEVVYLGPEPCEVASVDEFGVLLRARLSRLPCHLTHAELAELYTSGKLVVPAAREATLEEARQGLLDTNFMDHDVEQRLIAKRMLDYVLAIDRVPYGSKEAGYEQAVRCVAVTHPSEKKRPCVRTVREWRRIWIKGDRKVVALISLTGRRGNYDPRLHETVQRLLRLAVEEFYCSPEKPTIAAVHRALGALLHKWNTHCDTAFECPSERAVHREVDKLSKFEIQAGREGRRAAKIRLTQYDAIPLATRVNQVWEIDQTLMDVHCYDNRTGFYLGRPWLTVIIDVYTRMCVGFYIGFHPPSSMTDILALRHAILPKDDIKDLYPGVRFPYLAHGRPEILISDRGSSLMSEHFTDTLLELGIEHWICAPRQPWLKAHIERFILTCIQRHHTGKPGNVVGPNKFDRAYKPKELACLSEADLVADFVQWLNDDYHQSPHAGIGMTPAMKWVQAITEVGGEVPRPVPPKTDLKMLTGLMLECAPQHYGIKRFNLFWQHDRLATLRSYYGNGFKLKVSFDLNNLATVEAYDPLSKEWFTMKSAKKYRAYTDGLTLYQHQVISAHARLKLRAHESLTREALLESRAELLMAIWSMRPARTKAFAKIIRFLNTTPDGMGAKILELSDALDATRDAAAQIQQDLTEERDLSSDPARASSPDTEDPDAGELEEIPQQRLLQSRDPNREISAWRTAPTTK